MINLTGKVLWINILEWTDWIWDQYQSSSSNQLHYLTFCQWTLILSLKVRSHNLLPENLKHFLFHKTNENWYHGYLATKNSGLSNYLPWEIWMIIIMLNLQDYMVVKNIICFSIQDNHMLIKSKSFQSYRKQSEYFIGWIKC